MLLYVYGQSSLGLSWGGKQEVMRDTGDGADAHEPLVVTLGVDVCVGIAVARGDRHVGSFLLVSASAPDSLLHLQET